MTNQAKETLKKFETQTKTKTKRENQKTNQNANETQFQISYQNVIPNGIEFNQNAVRN